MFVAGVDSTDDVAARQVLTWLLMGAAARDVLDVARLPTSLEGVVVCVYPDGAAIYVSREGYDVIAPTTFGGQWENVAVYCPSADVEDNPDDAEEHKVASFVQMLAGRERLGFATAPKKTSKKTSAKEPAAAGGLTNEVERWPLVQAYGLEGVGRPGFLTMSHTLVDISEPIREQCYSELDAHTVRVMLSNACVLLGKHARELFALLDAKLPPDREHLTEKQVGEPIVSFFAYGSLRPPPECGRLLTMGPRCAAGIHTNSEADSPGNAAQVPICTLGSDGQRALHAVLEAADPRSPLRCARTFFLASGSLASAAAAHELLSAEVADEALEEARDADDSADKARTYGADDLVLLMRLYCALREACLAAISHFATSPEATARSARHVALETLAQSAAMRGIPLVGDDGDTSALRSRVKFALWAGDHANNAFANPAQGSRQIKVCRIALHDITSLDGEALLGALVYADSFVEHDGQVALLTEHVPLFTSYLQSGGEERLNRQLTRSLKAISSMRKPSSTLGERTNLGGSTSEQVANNRLASKRDTLGRALFDGSEPCALWCGGGLCLPIALQGQLIAFRYGLGFFDCPHHAPIVLCFQGAAEEIRDADTGFSCRILAVYVCGLGEDGQTEIDDPRDQLGPYIALQVEQPPYAALGGAPFVYLPLGSFTRSAQRIMQRETLPTWKEAALQFDIPYTVVDYARMPDSFAEMMPLVQQSAVNEDDLSTLTPAKDGILKALDFSETSLDRTACIPDELEHVVTQLEQRAMRPVADGGTNDGDDSRTIRLVPLFGLPGAHHENVAASIVRYAGDSAHVHVSLYPLDAPICPNEATLGALLDSAVDAFACKAADSSNRFALIALPSYVDAAWLYRMLCTEAETRHPGVFSILGGITTVHTDSVTARRGTAAAAFRRGLFIRHRGFTPGALEQLNSRYVRSVVSIEPSASASGGRATSRPFSARPASARVNARSTNGSAKASDSTDSAKSAESALLADVNDAIAWQDDPTRLVVRCVFSGGQRGSLLAANVVDAWQDLITGRSDASDLAALRSESAPSLTVGIRPEIGRWIPDPRFAPIAVHVRAVGDVDTTILCEKLAGLSHVLTCDQPASFALAVDLEERQVSPKLVLDVHGFVRHNSTTRSDPGQSTVLQILGSGSDILTVPCAWLGELTARQACSGLPDIVASSSPGLDIVVRCIGLDINDVQRAVLASGIPPPPMANERLTARDLSAKEVAHVKKHVVNDAARFPLPDDVVFDGVSYRDCFGDVLPDHPRLGEALAAFAEEKNDLARAENASAREANAGIQKLRLA